MLFIVLEVIVDENYVDRTRGFKEFSSICPCNNAYKSVDGAHHVQAPCPVWLTSRPLHPVARRSLSQRTLRALCSPVGTSSDYWRRVTPSVLTGIYVAPVVLPF